LLDGALTKTYAVTTDKGVVQQDWYFPSREDCLACHTAATKFVLGLNTRQTNRDLDYGTGTANQIEHLSRLGVFQQLAPAEANCEACPRWGDLNAAAELLARAYLDVHCAMCHAPEQSEIYARMSRRGPRQMPPLATSVTDDDALAVFRRWIAGL